MCKTQGAFEKNVKNILQKFWWRNTKMQSISKSVSLGNIGQNINVGIL